MMQLKISFALMLFLVSTTVTTQAQSYKEYMVTSALEQANSRKGYTYVIDTIIKTVTDKKWIVKYRIVGSGRSIKKGSDGRTYNIGVGCAFCGEIFCSVEQNRVALGIYTEVMEDGRLHRWYGVGPYEKSKELFIPYKDITYSNEGIVIDVAEQYRLNILLNL